jgi:DNA modification methylase
MLDNKKMLDDIGYNFNYEIVWNKNRGVSFLTAKKRPLQKHETIFVFSKGSTKYYYDQCKDHGFKKTKRGNYTVKKDYVEIKTNIHNNDGSRFMTTVLDYQVSSYDKQTSHPFEKPSPLCEKLVLAYTKENDLIIDPYSGSGNICKALKSKMRNFIGVETNLKYHTESIANINNTEISPLENVLVNDLFNDVDGRNWAKKWMELVKKDPTIINDEEIMSNWFANAIMTGHDNATKVI